MFFKNNKVYFLFFILTLGTIICSSSGYPYDVEDAASEENKSGRVQIKVFRGPTEHDGHQEYAPWGYWVKQPAED